MPPLSREEIAKHLQITLEELAAIIEGNKFPSDVQRWKILELFIMKTGNGGIATDPQFLEMRRVIEKKFPDAVFMSVDELLELSDMIEFASVTGSKLLRTHPTDRAKFLAFREKRAERVNALEIAVEKLRLALTKEQPKYKDDELFSEVLSRAFQFLNQTTIQAPNHYIKAIIKKNRGRNLNSWIYKHSN